MHLMTGNLDNTLPRRQAILAAGRRTPHRGSFALGVVIAVAAALFCGCAARPASGPQLASQAIVLSEDSTELDEQISSFVDTFESAVEHLAMELERKAATPEERRSAILLRVRLTAECRDAAGQPDPKESLLDLWTLSQSTFDFLANGEGKSLFGERQPMAVAAARAILDDIEILARRCIDEASYEHARQAVLAYANKRPMQSGFSKRPARDLSDEPQGEALQRIISLPLAPLTALAGVGRAPDSIRSVSHSVDRFTDVAEDFPANVRWQSQLLAMNLGESPQVAGTVASVQRFADSSAALAASSTEFVRVAEEMPRNLRSEAECLLERFDASQPGLQTTLGEATRTVESVSEASERIRGSAAEVALTVDQVRDASESLEKAAIAVKQTAGEILKFIPSTMKDENGQVIGRTIGADTRPAAVGTEVRPFSVGDEVRFVAHGVNAAGVGANQAVASAATTAMHDARIATAETATLSAGGEDKSFSFQAVGHSAQALGETADKLRELLTDFRGLLDGGTLSREAGALDLQLRNATDTTGLKLRELIDHAAKRAAQLLCLLFALLAAHAVLSRWIGKRNLRHNQA